MFVICQFLPCWIFNSLYHKSKKSLIYKWAQDDLFKCHKFLPGWIERPIYISKFNKFKSFQDLSSSGKMVNRSETLNPYRLGLSGTQWRAGYEQMKDHFILSPFPLPISLWWDGAPVGQVFFKPRIWLKFTL